jgi:hypothetical protein
MLTFLVRGSDVAALDEAVAGLSDCEEDALRERLRHEGIPGLARCGLPLLGERISVKCGG